MQGFPCHSLGLSLRKTRACPWLVGRKWNNNAGVEDVFRLRSCGPRPRPGPRRTHLRPRLPESPALGPTRPGLTVSIQCASAPRWPGWHPGRAHRVPTSATVPSPARRAVSVPRDSALRAAQGEDPSGCHRALSCPLSWRLDSDMLPVEQERVFLSVPRAGGPAGVLNLSTPSGKGPQRATGTLGDHRLPPRAGSGPTCRVRGQLLPSAVGTVPTLAATLAVWRFLLATAHGLGKTTDPNWLPRSLPLSNQRDETSRTATAIVPRGASGGVL